MARAAPVEVIIAILVSSVFVKDTLVATTTSVVLRRGKSLMFKEEEPAPAARFLSVSLILANPLPSGRSAPAIIFPLRRSRMSPTEFATTSAPMIMSPSRRDRKSTRLNSSHLGISYAVFCLKKKKRKKSIQGYGKPKYEDDKEMEIMPVNGAIQQRI